MNFDLDVRSLLMSLWTSYIVLLHVTAFLLGTWLVLAALGRPPAAVRARMHAASLIGMLGVTVLCFLPVGWWWLRVLPGPLTEPFIRIGAASIAADAGSSPVAWMLGALWIVYVAGAAFSLCRLGIGCWLMQRASDRARPATEREWVYLLRGACVQMGTSQAIELRHSADVATAVTWGVLDPVILLPEGAEMWPVQHRRLVLLHELAHIRRGDWAVRLLAQLSRAVFWFHPGARVSLRALVSAQEEACDELVVNTGARRSDYAECLLKSADWVRDRSSARTTTLALGITSPPQVHRRVQLLLQAPRAQPRPRAVKFASAAVVMLWVLVAGSVRLAPRREVMWQALESSDWTRRAYAASFLSQTRNPAIKEQLSARTQGDPNAMVRGMARQSPR